MILTSEVVRLVAPRTLVSETTTLDTAALADDEIVVITRCSTISPGTELAAYVGLPPLRPGSIYPRYLGYCNCGEVIAAGSRVTGISVGDRVLTHAAHRSSYRISQHEVLARVPPNIEPDKASVTYLFHLGYSAMLRANVQAGQHVAVVGLGALGIGSVAVAQLMGAEVFAVSNRESALLRARRCGAKTVLVADDTAFDKVDADVVVSTSNTWADWKLALRLVRRGGVVAVLGFPGRGEPPPPFNPLDSQYFYDKQITLMGVGQDLDQVPGSRSPSPQLRANMRYLLDAIGNGRLPAAEFSSQVRPASELAAAYDDLIARRHDVLTYVLRWAA